MGFVELKTEMETRLSARLPSRKALLIYSRNIIIVISDTFQEHTIHSTNVFVTPSKDRSISPLRVSRNAKTLGNSWLTKVILDFVVFQRAKSTLKPF